VHCWSTKREEGDVTVICAMLLLMTSQNRPRTCRVKYVTIVYKPVSGNKETACVAQACGPSTKATAAATGKEKQAGGKRPNLERGEWTDRQCLLAAGTFGQVNACQERGVGVRRGAISPGPVEG